MSVLPDCKELKFRAWNTVRAWDTEAKCYIEEPILVDNFGKVYVVCEKASNEQGTCLITGNPNIILEQYTGLKDKNGKEIYEEDIVLDCYDGDDAFIVEWDKDTASFILTDTEHILNVSFDNFYPDKDLEIIGNTHENKEPLETKDEI